MIPRPHLVYCPVVECERSTNSHFYVEMWMPGEGKGGHFGERGKYISGIVHEDGTFRPLNSHLTKAEFKAANDYG